MHSTEHHQVDQLLTLERLTAIEFTLEHTLGGPALDDMLPVARRILERKPLILAALDLDTAERCLAELPARTLVTLALNEAASRRNTLPGWKSIASERMPYEWRDYLPACKSNLN